MEKLWLEEKRRVKPKHAERESPAAAAVTALAEEGCVVPAVSPEAVCAGAPTARMRHRAEQLVEVVVLAAAADVSSCTGDSMRNEIG